MIVLDTNVISELMHPRANPNVVAWVDEQAVNEVYLTAVTATELHYGVACLPDGHRKTDLADRVRRAIQEDFPGRSPLRRHRRRPRTAWRGHQHGRRPDRCDMSQPLC
jgi:predicted nucleic acid-binding protein